MGACVCVCVCVCVNVCVWMCVCFPVSEREWLPERGTPQVHGSQLLGCTGKWCLHSLSAVSQVRGQLTFTNGSQGGKMHIIQSSVLGLVSVNVSNILVPSTPYFSVFFSCCNFTCFVGCCGLKTTSVSFCWDRMTGKKLTVVVVSEISPLQAVLLTVCVVRTCECGSLFRLCLGSLLCNGLCAPIWKNST